MDGGTWTEDVLSGPRGRRLLGDLVDAAGTGREVEPWAWPAHGRLEHGPLPDALAVELLPRLRDAVAAVDLDALARLADPRALLPALLGAVGSARYWQHPDEVDVVLADDRLARLLRPVAQAVLAAPAAAWFSDGVDPDAQQHLHWIFERRDRHVDPAPATTGAAAALHRWRAEAALDEERCRRDRPSDPDASWSGTWWSAPPSAPELLVTTPVLRTAGAPELPVGMVLVEDEMGVEEVRARAVRLRSGLRVHEVHDARSWTDLVEAHPRSVTWSRRHDWWRAAGWAGTWTLPDWASVAREWDGVHLSVRGYLAVSGRPLVTALPGEAAEGVQEGPARTLLAGWNPGRTHWLTDVVADVGEPVTWRSEEYPLRWSTEVPG